MNLISSPAKLSRSLVQKKKKKALTVFTTPLLKLVICCVTYRRKDDKIPRSRLKYHRRLPHYSGDWQLQLPSQQDDRAVFDRSLSSCDDTVWCDETGVTASAIYDRDNFFSAAKFVLVFFMLHTELLLHRTENCNFEWTVFLSSAFFFFFFIHGYNMPRRLPKQSFHFDWSVLNWGNRDGLIGFGDIVIPFSSFDCSTFKQQSAVIHPLQSSLQRNVFKDILGFVISTPFSERHIVGFLTTIKWLSVSWSCAHWASQTFFFLFYYFSFLSNLLSAWWQVELQEKPMRLFHLG